MKKLLLSLGAVSTILAPMTLVVACSENDTNESPVKEENSNVDPSPENNTPDSTEPEVTEPEVTEPEVTEPEVTEPEVTEPEVTEPEVTEPEVTEPEVTEPTEPENDSDDSILDISLGENVVITGSTLVLDGFVSPLKTDHLDVRIKWFNDLGAKLDTTQEITDIRIRGKDASASDNGEYLEIDDLFVFADSFYDNDSQLLFSNLEEAIAFTETFINPDTGLNDMTGETALGMVITQILHFYFISQ